MRFLPVLAAQVICSIALSLAGDHHAGVQHELQLSLVDESDQARLHFATPFESGNDDSATLYRIISNDERFSLLTKAINFVDGVEEILDDEDAQLTFFAPPDEALRRPGKKDSRSDWLSLEDGFSTLSLPDALDLVDDLELSACMEKPDKEKRKKILKIIIRAILEYHIIPTGAVDVHSLGTNLTYATHLKIPGTLDGGHQRLRVEQKILPPSTTVNFYSRVTHPDIKATNGILHVVNHPILPPPSVFSGLYLFPHFFSTFTSALQRSGLTEDLDLRWKHGEGLKGASAVTVFAPLNHAFDRLPRRLQLYLFSPFGGRVLKKLIQYHVVPDVVLFTDHVHFKKESQVGDATIIPHANKRPASSSILPDWLLGVSISRPEPIVNATLALDTLFTNHTIRAQVLKTKVTYPFPGPKKPSRYETKVFANGHYVALPDVVALNGAVHVIPKLLDPRKRHHGHHGHDDLDEDWNDWEKWLPQWASEVD